MAQFKVFCPKIKVVKIKHQGRIYKYDHGSIAEEQSFFAKYPHIFHPVDGSDAQEPKKKKVAKKPKVEKVVEPVAEAVDPPFKIEETDSKGWFIVTQDGVQVYPTEDGKKCRKSAAEQFVEEQK